jgi:uncharacterized membrane protein
MFYTDLLITNCCIIIFLSPAMFRLQSFIHHQGADETCRAQKNNRAAVGD